ncbi:MAG: hypothetical protein IJQ10_00760 [Clostridia bacterium]|nr:hypothetical protein [Clostridia bacterium]
MTKYKDFVKSTGYGTGGGLCGWNCRHSFIPFDPETMKNNLKKYGLEENKKMYENHQKQRFFERNVRKYKKLAKLTKTALQKARNHEKSSLNRKYIHYKQLATKWRYCKNI